MNLLKRFLAWWNCDVSDRPQIKDDVVANVPYVHSDSCGNSCVTKRYGKVGRIDGDIIYVHFLKEVRKSVYETVSYGDGMTRKYHVSKLIPDGTKWIIEDHADFGCH